MVLGFVGPTEVVIILIIVLLVFGPQKLPEVSRQIGSAFREMNRMRSEVTRVLDFDTYAQPYDMPPYESPQGATYSQNGGYDYSGSDGNAYPYSSEYDEERLSTALAVVPPGPTPGPNVAPRTVEFSPVTVMENGNAVADVVTQETKT